MRKDMTPEDWDDLGSYCAGALLGLLEARIAPSGRVTFNCFLPMEVKQEFLTGPELRWHGRRGD